MAAADRYKPPHSLNVRSQKDWHTLCSEYNLCKRKLQAKKDALLILAKELDNVRQEKDAFRLMAEQLREKYQELRRQCTERERALGLSLNESDPFSERRNNSLAQVLREARDQNQRAQTTIAELEQKLAEAQGDIKLLRENIARQRIGDDGIGTRHFPAHEREELVSQLEAAREQLQALERDLVAKIDEQTELVLERGHFRDKADRLNQELNYILGGDEKRIVDVDALIMENKYVKERLKGALEEKSIANATVAKYKAAIERKRGKNSIKLGSTTSGGLFVSPKQVEQLLAEGKSGGIAATPSSVADLQSLAKALLETIHDKNMALNHQRNTNKILGQRVAGLEKKLKTLEISGLWNLPPGKNAAFVACEVQNMKAGQKMLIPRQASDASDDSCADSNGSSLTPSLNSSAKSSPSRQPNADDNDSLITLRSQEEGSEDTAQLDELSQLIKQAGGDASPAPTGRRRSLTRKGECNWRDVLQSDDPPATAKQQPSTIEEAPLASSPDKILSDGIKESDAPSTKDSQTYRPQESQPVTEFTGLQLPDDAKAAIEQEGGSPSESASRMDSRPLTDGHPAAATSLQESLDSAGNLLETASEKLSSHFSKSDSLVSQDAPPSQGALSPLLATEKPSGAVDMAPHRV